MGVLEINYKLSFNLHKFQVLLCDEGGWYGPIESIVRQIPGHLVKKEQILMLTCFHNRLSMFRRPRLYIH